MKKSSVSLQVFVGVMFALGLLTFFFGWAEISVMSRFTFGAWMASIGLAIAFIFGIIMNNLGMTEEEGRLPEKSKESGSEDEIDCCDSEKG